MNEPLLPEIISTTPEKKYTIIGNLHSSLVGNVAKNINKAIGANSPISTITDGKTDENVK